MSSANVDLVRGFYTDLERGDAAAAMARLSPAIVWSEAEGFPYADGNPYVGPDAVAAGVFARLGGEWDGFGAEVEEVLDAGDRVVITGRYVGTFKATGKTIHSQFAHVWTVDDGVVIAFQQYVDTLGVAYACGVV